MGQSQHRVTRGRLQQEPRPGGGRQNVKGGGSSNILMACQSVSVGRVWWRWRMFCSSATPSTTQPISLYSNNQEDWLRNPCLLPCRPCLPCLPCPPASPSPPWEALWQQPRQWTAERLRLQRPTVPSSPPAEGEDRTLSYSLWTPRVLLCYTDRSEERPLHVRMSWNIN